MRHLYRSFCLLKSVTPLLGLIILATSCGKDPAVDPDTDGTVRIAKECTSGLKPVNIVITGDGFLEEDYATGGAFDQAANRAIDALFSVEPFKTYSAYFRVQTVTAYSEERGATLKNASTKTNTIFGVTLDGGSSTGMSGKDDKVFDYAKKAQGITATELKQTVVIVISNYVQYACTTYSYSDGRAIAYIALSSGTSQLTRFGNVVVHEAGGHGFGRLADEYYNSNSGNINNDPDALLEIIEWQDRGYDQNVSLTPLHSKCPWNFIFTLPQYQSDYNTVSTIEGGALFAEGVWRPEPISCMNDNRLYFNAPSRVAIVKRIVEIAGTSFSMQEFIDKDYDRFNTPAVLTSHAKAAAEEGFTPLAPPVRIR